MAKVTLTFDAPLNASCQVGDTAYHVARQSEGVVGKYHWARVGLRPISQINTSDSSSPVLICEIPLA